MIGAGAAGLMAAAAAAQAGNAVTVIEKNEKAGKKIYITGKGRCNLTNDCATEDFFGQVVTNPKFLYSAVYSFDHDMVKDFFEENGCPLKVERGNRVFPVSDHASDVTAALLRCLQRYGGRILYRTRAEEILTDGSSAVRGVRLADGRELDADAVILCTGGLSYPSTGSTGDGYRMAERLGLKLVPTAPSLVPFETKERWCRELQGLALKNVSIRIFRSGEVPGTEAVARDGTAKACSADKETLPEKNDDIVDGKPDNACHILSTEVPENADGGSVRSKLSRQQLVPENTDVGMGTAGRKKGKKRKKEKPVYEAFGELLFTHFGLSGPIILSASSYCDFTKAQGGFKLLLNLKPALTPEQVEERLRREFALAPDRHLPGAIRPLFPARLAEAVTELSGLDTARRAASFTEKEIRGLAALIQEVPITVTGTRGYEEAIITRGGISVREFDPSTMECRSVRGLYAAGEVLDVDAVTGGFNLQIAWSTGHLAGSSI